MKRRKSLAKLPRQRLRSTIGRKARHTTVHGQLPAPRPQQPTPPRSGPRPAAPSPERPVSRRQAGRIIDPDDSTLLDIVDNLLSKGVVINADVILALADVDLVYLRLSALLCAADRVLPPGSR